MHAISSYCGNRPTNKPTNRQDQLQYTASLNLVCSVIMTSRYLLATGDTVSQVFHRITIVSNDAV